MPQTIFIRTDASLAIGGGHVTRCLALASELQRRGATVRFICRRLNGHLIELIERAGFAVDHLNPPRAGAPFAVPSTAHGAWLETDTGSDAAETAGVISARRGADWLVVDHYALDRSWEDAVRERGGVRKVCVIDDLADRFHRCELLLDQSLAPDAPGRYRGLLAHGDCSLLGPRYALLRREFSDRRETVRPRNGQVRRLLISFGAMDRGNQTLRALEALSLVRGATGLEIDVVIGPGNPHEKSVRAAAARFAPRIQIHSPAQQVAELMARNDLALGAAGTTSWERCSVGLPALVVCTGDNQRLMCQMLHEAGALHYLGEEPVMTHEIMANALRDHLGSPAKVAAMSLAALKVTDGYGALRAACYLGPLRLRRARLEDARLVWEWANDNETRQNSFHPEPIPWAVHENWFATRLASAGSWFWLAELAGEPIGQVRFEIGGSTAVLSISLAPHFRGQGHGLELLLKALAQFFAAHPEVRVRAEAKVANAASVRLFELAGFTAVTSSKPAVATWEITEEQAAVYRFT